MRGGNHSKRIFKLDMLEHMSSMLLSAFGASLNEHREQNEHDHSQPEVELHL